MFSFIAKNIRLIGLKNKNFTIISDNCWGWFVYKYFWLEYQSPFVGLFLFPNCYIRLLENFDYLVSQDLIFIEPSESIYFTKLKKWGTAWYPIWLLGSVELHFLHYNSKKDAFEKWNRRKKRINYNNLLVKFSEGEEDLPELVKRFEKLSFVNKVCFSKQQYSYKSVLKFPISKKLDWKSEWYFSKKVIWLKNILNNL